MPGGVHGDVAAWERGEVHAAVEDGDVGAGEQVSDVGGLESVFGEEGIQVARQAVRLVREVSEIVEF